MSKGPASEGALGDLHNKVAKVMTRALDQIEQRQDQYDQTAGTSDEEVIEPPELNPALLSVMVRFLDANKITCAPEAGNEMNELQRKLDEKRKKRRVGNVTHIFEDE